MEPKSLGDVDKDSPKATLEIDNIELGEVESHDMDIQARDYRKRQVFRGRLLFWLAYQSTGVIYGDIGTSPLYVYSSTFSEPPSRDNLLGALSIIIWSLTLIVTVKYCFIVLRADDEGEGGTFALHSLLSRYALITHRDAKTQASSKLERYQSHEMKPANHAFRSWMEKSWITCIFLQAFAVFGVSLIMADGVLTPAQSVLGAIQGLEVVVPGITTSTIIGVTCAILVVLFLLQPLGIAKLGSVFAPVVIIWLTFNGAFGIYNLAMHDAGVLKAWSPYFAGLYFVRNKTDAWKSLGGILLCFTGVEALFADLGAFSRRAVQLSWLCFTYPCLLLAYIGQAAYMMEDPSAYSNPFFNTLPPGMFYPSLVISILAAIVASQAIITSTFQLLSQVMTMSYFPRITTVYTSTTFHGQVYIPVANWLLMIGTVIVTAVYSNTTRLGHAYGVCVILVTFITTCLVAIVAVVVWRLNTIMVLAVWLVFATLDGLFLSSALTKVPDGAWFTILLAIILASIFVLWRFGKEQQWKSEGRDRLALGKLVVRDEKTGKECLHSALGGNELTKIKGVGIYFDKVGDASPPVYAHFIQKFEARPEIQIFLHLRALSLPTVAEEERYTVNAVPGIRNCYRVTARHGYNDEIVTNDLGNVLYTQVRKFIIQGSKTYKILQQEPTRCIEGDRISLAASETADAEATGVSTTSGAVMQRRVVDPRTASVSEIQAEVISLGSEADLPTTSISVAGALTEKVDVSSATAAQPQPQVTFEVSSLPVAAVSKNDASTGARLSTLDRAFQVQTVYIVGKEELRLVRPKKLAVRDIIRFKPVRSFFLYMFLWIRENTRAKVKDMKVPVEKLVEVGFVNDLY